MAKFDFIHLISFVIFLFSALKVTNSQGTFLVDLRSYTEHVKGVGVRYRCLKLCVTTSPSGFPRCNLNTTANTKDRAWIQLTEDVYNPWAYDTIPTFSFSDWEDNSELSVVVWTIPTSSTTLCETTDPTNTTTLGEATVIIPRLEQYKVYDISTDNWTLEVSTRLKCKITGCLAPCVARDNSTGHYTCDEGNKKCLPKWFGENCLKTCVKPSDPPAGHYKCSKTGQKGCLPNWFGENCTTYCDKSSSAYTCDEEGKRTCFKNWFGKDCATFCVSNRTDTHAGNYLCDSIGNRVCLQHWYGKNCTDYCNNSAVNYKCDDKGSKVCLRNWYGVNCSKFCNNNDKKFKCNVDGDKVCMRNWYGVDCSKFCNNTDKRFKCNVDGDKVCMRNWYGVNCSKFCNNSDVRYKCDNRGDKICLRNWHGKNCSRFCDESSHLTKEGGRYRCVNGEKMCAKDWYGENCNINCTLIGISESISKTPNAGLYYCKTEGSKENLASCPHGWKDTKCLEGCESTDQKVQQIKTGCNANKEKRLLCSNLSATYDLCHFVAPEKLESEGARRRDVSDATLYGALFGVLFVVLIVTTVIVVYVSLKKKQTTTTSPASPTYETPIELMDGFTREFNRAELTLNIDELIRRRMSRTDDLGYDNEGLMVENPLYGSGRNMRAVTPYKEINSSSKDDEVFTMNTSKI
ncbi:protein jagged-1b-like [Dendronephthya gigantea]|uniref:protein jagged-1b-like n=1 Tax=Dendronephthya gigantea TaxID=151771 RepID=UPI001069C907|nr:protein jagged-1b-like [Dendronephthya gigantea]